MRYACIVLLFVTALAAFGQRTDANAPSISVRTSVVLVPALAKTKQGTVVFNLTANDFALTDNGIAQQLTLDTDTDSEPLALAICVETGGAGANHIEEYDHLDAILASLIGGVEHRVAVIGFDSEPHLLLPFTPETGSAAVKLAGLSKGNRGAAILDGVAFATEQLRAQPANYRRAILLFSETIDQGSRTSLGEALRLISDTNTTLYSFGFSSTKAELGKNAPGVQVFGYDHPNEPGPPHGCFSREGADAEYDGHYSRQVFDCLALLAPPLRLAQMAYLTARNGLRVNTSATLAELTGGEFFHYSNAKDLRQGLIAVSHDVLQYYVLSFRPAPLTPGPHALHLEITNHPDVKLSAARTAYWIDDAGQ